MLGLYCPMVTFAAARENAGKSGSMSIYFYPILTFNLHQHHVKMNDQLETLAVAAAAA